MADETVVKVGADASGYTAELDKARKSANAFIATQSDMAQRTALAQEAIAEATANGSDASARAVKSFTDALLKTASTAGKTRAEILAMRAANLGLGDSVKPYIDQITAATTHTHSFSLESSAAKRELLVLGHELSQGNIKNFAGSLSVLAERTGAFNVLLQPAVLGVGAFIGVIGIAAHLTLAAREELATYGDTVEQISKQTGLTTDDVQKFGFAAQTVGINTKDAAAALGDLTKAQNEAQHGNKDAAAAFAAVGISMATLKSASPDQLLGKVADAFSKSADGAGKAAVANELFGDKGKELIPLLDQGSTHLAALGVVADQVGAVMSSSTIAQLSALQRQLDESRAKMDAMALSAKTALLPTIINLTNALADNVAMKPLLTDFYTGVAFIMKTAASAIATVVVGFEQTSEVIATLATVTYYGMTGQFKMAADAAQAGYDNLKKQGQGYVQFMNTLWSNTTPGASHSVAPAQQINFAKGDNSPKPYQESRGDSLLDQAKQAQASLQASLDGQEKLTGWAAKEVELRAEIDDFAGKTLSKAQQSILANRQSLLDQYSLNASLEQQLDLRTRMEKLNTEARETNIKIVNQNDAIAQQHQIELTTLGLGTKERQRQVDLLKIETDRQKELADWAKKAAAQNLTGTDQDTDERALINQRYDWRRTEQTNFNAGQDMASGEWMSGAKTGLQDIIDKTNDLASAANGAATDAISSLGDTIANFVTTGKLSFSDFAKSVVASFVKMESEAFIAKSVLAAFDFFGSGSGASAASTSTPADLIAGYTGKATGGKITGPGSGTSDSIPIRVSNGEGIVTAEGMKRLGEPALNAINSGASVHAMTGFATGGVVGSAGSPGIGGGGGDVTLNLYGAPEGTKVQKSRSANGGLQIDAWLQQIDNHIASGIASGRGATARTLQKTYGVNRMLGQT